MNIVQSMSRNPPHLQHDPNLTANQNPPSNGHSAQSERRTFVARSNLFLNFQSQRRNIQSLISPAGISILSPTSPTGTIFSQIRISPNSNLSPMGMESGLSISRRVLGPPDKETETFINTVLELEKEHSRKVSDNRTIPDYHEYAGTKCEPIVCNQRYKIYRICENIDECKLYMNTEFELQSFIVIF